MSQQFINEVYAGVVARDVDETSVAVKKAIKAGADPLEIVEQGLTKGMETVGEKFEVEALFLPDLLLASACVQEAMGILKPLISGDDGNQCTFLIGTVEGDIHDIGKNLVATTLEATGFNVIDLGVSVPAKDFVAAIKKYNPDLVGISALITSTMINMQDVIDLIVEEGLRNKIKIIVGGAPLDQSFADSIGADYYGKTVRDAVIVGKALKEGK